jgi:phospholipase C
MTKNNFFILTSALFISFHLWAAPNCSVKPGTIGHSEKNPIQHIVIIMQENHSFDSYFGELNDKKFYGDQIDGVTPQNSPQGYYTGNFCPKDPDHSWEAAHKAFNNGKLDRFEEANIGRDVGKEVFVRQGEKELGFYYDLANHYATADRYFSSVMGPTFPNRFYLYAGTSFGHIMNDDAPPGGFTQKTVFDSLGEKGISWKYYYSSPGHYLDLFKSLRAQKKDHFARIREFAADAAADHLPQVILLESAEDSGDEHPPANVKVGQKWVYKQLKALMTSKAWSTSVVFITWDENGGFYDHVIPPEACAPDEIPPSFLPTDYKSFDRLGFRVPFLLISPYAKRHFVSHQVFDHTSILKFVEDQFALPYLSYRDANANSLSALMDYAHPDFVIPEFRDPGKAVTVGCTYPKTWFQNQYNILAHWWKELMADFGHSDLL